MAGLKIKQVADASGFSAATLRYYEQVGLIPAPGRSAAGYRLYDERVLDRLAFIARAKQLGCTLEEIADLSTAWDGGRCGPIQDQLRPLVADKIEETQTQIAELVRFTAELQQAAVALRRHRPDGACDADCGCVGDPEGAQPVALIDARPADDSEPLIACSLSAGSMPRRLTDWQSLLAHVERRLPIDDGVRCEFATSVPHDELLRLATAEQDCCRFFRFAITVDERGIALEVRAPHDAQPVVTAVFGAAA